VTGMSNGGGNTSPPPRGYDLVLEVCCKSLGLPSSLSTVKLPLCFPGCVRFSRQAYMLTDGGTMFGKLPS
jgi:hypothetical protein